VKAADGGGACYESDMFVGKVNLSGRGRRWEERLGRRLEKDNDYKRREYSSVLSKR